MRSIRAGRVAGVVQHMASYGGGLTGLTMAAGLRPRDVAALGRARRPANWTQPRGVHVPSRRPSRTQMTPSPSSASATTAAAGRAPNSRRTSGTNVRPRDRGGSARADRERLRPESARGHQESDEFFRP
jgi:hypothetical protein